MRKMIFKFNKKAFLLIEVFLTISILSIALTSIIHSFLSSLRATVYASEYSKAVLLLENKMYELLQRGTIKASIDTEEHFPAPNEKFNYHLKTRKKDDDAQSSINEVHLSISWLSGKRKNDIALTTYFFNEKE